MTLRLFFLIINIYLFLGFQPESAPHNLHPGKTLSTVCEAVCLLCSLAILCKMLNFLPLPRWVCLSDSITQKTTEPILSTWLKDGARAKEESVLALIHIKEWIQGFIYLFITV